MQEPAKHDPQKHPPETRAPEDCGREDVDADARWPLRRRAWTILLVSLAFWALALWALFASLG